MKKRYKVEKKPLTGKFLTIIILSLAISVGSILSVMANTLPCKVIDGQDIYEFSLLAPDDESILEEAVQHGMPLLGENDIYNAEGLTLTVDRLVNISFDDGKQMQNFKAHEGITLENALLNEGIEISENDIIDLPLDTILEDDIKVNASYYTPINVFVDGTLHETFCYGGTVKELLDKLNINPADDDLVKPSLDTKLNFAQQISVQSKREISLTHNAKTENYSTFALTVGDFLSEQGIALSEHDEVTPSKDSPITGDMSINIDVVTYKDVIKTETIAFDTVKQYNPSMYKGESKVVKNGVDGEKELVYTEKYINGELVETSEVTENITKEAVSKIVAYGSKDKETVKPDNNSDSSNDSDSSNNSSSSKTFVDHNGKTVSYKSVVVDECTAYTATGNPTSLGGVAKVGVVAVNPKVIPYGTKMYITSNSVVYGYAVAGDTGGALMAGDVFIDLFYNTERECINFGRRDMTIYFLD